MVMKIFDLQIARKCENFNSFKYIIILLENRFCSMFLGTSSHDRFGGDKLQKLKKARHSITSHTSHINKCQRFK